MVITTIIIFLLILGVLVFVHEFGHFIMAKRAGVKVEEFGFGFPPKIFGIKRGETEYTINMIPLGGFVRILGENGEDKANPRSFSAKSGWQRFKMLAAGVSANILLAVVLFSIISYVGMPVDAEVESGAHDVQVRINQVADNSPAKSAGLAQGDAILTLSADNQKVDVVHTTDVENFINSNKGKEITFEIGRGKEIKDIKVMARAEVPEGQGPTGISLLEVGTISYPWYQAIWQGILRTWYVIALIFKTLWDLLKGLLSTGHVAGQLAGPVGIAVITGQVAQQGIIYILQFTAMLSVNLAVVNALPFPALDGGRILFLGIEKAKGKPVSQETENTIHTIGFVFLLLVMVLVTFKDFKTFDIWQKIKAIL